MRNTVTKVAIAASLALGLNISANAAFYDLHQISGTETITSVTENGPFVDFYTFTVNPLKEVGTAATSVNFSNYGAMVSAAALYVGTFQSDVELASAMPISASPVTTHSPSGTANITTIASSANLIADTQYTFRIAGTSQGAAGYTAIIAMRDVSPVSAVPEPETYAMLVAGLGMMGMIARRRQKNS